jgi:hypothetical protein
MIDPDGQVARQLVARAQGGAEGTGLVPSGLPGGLGQVGLGQMLARSPEPLTTTDDDRVAMSQELDEIGT